MKWAEASGYDIEYAVNNDLEFHPEILSNYRLMLSIGHDEYWSSPMRDAVESFVRRGGNVAFFSGNTCCWQVRNEDGGPGTDLLEAMVQHGPSFSKRAGKLIEYSLEPPSRGAGRRIS